MTVWTCDDAYVLLITRRAIAWVIGAADIEDIEDVAFRLDGDRLLVVWRDPIQKRSRPAELLGMSWESACRRSVFAALEQPDPVIVARQEAQAKSSAARKEARRLRERRTRADDLYEREFGEPPNLPADHPDRWQWEYLGTPAERESLLDRLAGPAEPLQSEVLF